MSEFNPDPTLDHDPGVDDVVNADPDPAPAEEAAPVDPDPAPAEEVVDRHEDPVVDPPATPHTPDGGPTTAPPDPPFTPDGPPPPPPPPGLAEPPPPPPPPGPAWAPPPPPPPPMPYGSPPPAPPLEAPMPPPPGPQEPLRLGRDLGTDPDFGEGAHYQTYVNEQGKEYIVVHPDETNPGADDFPSGDPGSVPQPGPPGTDDGGPVGSLVAPGLTDPAGSVMAGGQPLVTGQPDGADGTTDADGATDAEGPVDAAPHSRAGAEAGPEPAAAGTDDGGVVPLAPGGPTDPAGSVMAGGQPLVTGGPDGNAGLLTGPGLEDPARSVMAGGQPLVTGGPDGGDDTTGIEEETPTGEIILGGPDPIASLGGTPEEIIERLTGQQLDGGQLTRLAALGAEDLENPGVRIVSPDDLSGFMEDEGLLAGVSGPEVGGDTIGTLITAGRDVIILGDGAEAVFPTKVVGIDGDAVTLRDPRGQGYRIPRAEFDNSWSKAANRFVSLPNFDELKMLADPIEPIAATTPPAPVEAEGGVNRGVVAASAIGIPLVLGGGYLAARKIKR